MTVTQRIKAVCLKYPKRKALQIKDGKGTFQPFSYEEFYKEISALGAFLVTWGLKRGDHVGIISDNRKEWIITDLAVMGIGGVDIPRGSDSTDQEICYILSHSESKVVFLENYKKAAVIAANLSQLPSLEAVVIFNSVSDDDVASLEKLGIKVLRYSDMVAEGFRLLNKNDRIFEDELDKGSDKDLATIIYTSGTTGTPKGVMLTHESFIYQIDRIKKSYLIVNPGATLLSMLPVWHAYERTIEYIVFFSGANVAYSQPIGSVLLNDIQKTHADWMTSVPRIWDGIRSAVVRSINKSSKIKKTVFYFFLGVGIWYKKMSSYIRGTVPQFHKRNRVVDFCIGIIPFVILFPFNLLGNVLVFRKFKKILGGNFTAGISGGGSLSSSTRQFFCGIGIKILEGYGLTETGPVLSVCKQKRPVYGTVGPILQDTEFKIVDKDGNALSHGEKGILWVRSPQVMLGYYKNEEATAKVMHDGWLNTGDIVMSTINNEIKIVGRAKETIVLRGGENIEPVPIENACLQSDYVDQIMVLGQDQKFIAALIVPDYKYLEERSKELGIAYMDMEDLVNNPQIYSLVYGNISDIVSKKNGFKNYEKIFRIKLLAKPFKVGDELTNSLKVKRDVVMKKYKSDIAKLFK